MLLVPLRLVQTVSGALPHLGILQSRIKMYVYVHFFLFFFKKGQEVVIPRVKGKDKTDAVTSFEETATVDVPEPPERRPHSQTHLQT